jgi:hypothetical protein
MNFTRASRRRNKSGIRRRPVFEQLETRELLTVAQDLAGAIARYQPALTAALNAATQLPLVGNQLTGLSEFTTALQNTEASIDSQTRNITANGHYQVTVPLPLLSKTFPFDLGLDAFLKAAAAGNVHAVINPTLMIGFDVTGGAASLDAGQTRFDIGFALSLPGFQGTFSLNGLLFTKAVDAGTSFNGDLGYRFASGGALNPQFSGEANVLLDLSMSFVDPALNAPFNPTFRTRLDLDWGFGTNNQLAAPHISLVNVGLEADSFLRGFLGDVVRTAQKFTKPIQPFIDIFQTPVPILSAFDSSQTIGTLMLKGAGTSAAQQDSFKLMVQIINAVNAIDLSGNTGGAVIPLGTITVTGNPQQAGGFGFNTSSLTTAIDDIFDVPALQAVEDAVRKVGNYAGTSSTAGFQFPLLENPGSVIAGILLGQPDTTLFSFSTGRQHFELAPSIGVGIPGVLGIFLDAGIIFDANLTMGYDTAGLLAYAQNPGNVGKLLHGFYFDNSVDTTVPPIPNGPAIRKTGLYLSGLMELKADALLAHASGGLYANIIVGLVNTDATNHVHLDTMIGNLTSGGKVFNLGGKLYASADLSLELSLPVGPDITLFSFNLAHEELLNFDPAPAPSGVPVTVIDVVDRHTLSLDVAKMGAGSVVTVQPFHDTTVSVGGSTFEADGIRVDYPGEIYLYVERKNNANINYYNLIALFGAAPAGVSINVIDPFRVFADEGAANPGPVQTKPAVLLAGGKDVIYSYSEASDGSKALVLLVGGYGSNTLKGGTMTFGNFIPGSRVALAKAHFANTSGFDGAGQALINSQIDAAMTPANLAGIIGAKMTGSRGGLMMGGPGNNSFIAMGAGVYEMIGGSWVNAFNISPSFSSGPAHYQIDAGGPGAGSLIVRVPLDEMADFENGAVQDKYRPEFKALNIESNAGVFTTAHGISKVLVIGAPGSTIVFGDTSELDIAFQVKGSGTLKFAGTAAPDRFDVSAAFDSLRRDPNENPLSGSANGWFGTPDARMPLRLMKWGVRAANVAIDNPPEDPNDFLAVAGLTVVPYDAGNLVYTGDFYGSVWALPNSNTGVSPIDYYAVPWEGLFHNILVYRIGGATYQLLPAWQTLPQIVYRFDSPLYTVARTFGTNGRTQNISFEMEEVPSSSIILDGRGESDQYKIDVGLGSFLDVKVEDSDATTQNVMHVNFSRTDLLPYQAVLSDDTLQLEYYTPSFQWIDFSYNVYNEFHAVKYSPTISFGANVDITLTSATPFQHTVINRPTARRDAAIVVTGFFPAQTAATRQYSIYVPELVGDTAPQGGLFQVYQGIGEIDVQANAGNLSINTVALDYFQNFFETRLKFRVHSNTGTITLSAPKTTSTLAYLDILADDNQGTVSALTTSAGMHLHSFSFLEGEAVSSGPVAIRKFGTLTVDGLPPGLAFDSNTGMISGVVASGSAQDSPYEVTIRSTYTTGNPPNTVTSTSATFAIRVSGISLVRPPIQLNHVGDNVNVAIQTSTAGGAALAFAVDGLPDGLSIDPATGVISGVVADQSGPRSFRVTVTATRGNTFASTTFDWSVLPIGVSDVVTFVNPGTQSNHEGDVVDLHTSAASSLGLPLSYTIAGLPPGLSFDSESGEIQGSIQAGSAIASPYHVSLTATDGFWSDQVAFDWFVATALSLPTLKIDTVTLAEGNAGTTAFVFTVTLSFDPSDPVRVIVNTADGTATVADHDYQAIANLVLTFNPGGPLSQTVTVLAGGDTMVEPDETFLVNLSSPVGATILSGQGMGTMLNDDVDIPTGPVLSLAGPAVGVRAQTLSFSFTVDGAAAWGDGRPASQDARFAASARTLAGATGGYTISIDWGDGRNQTIILASGDRARSLTHAYSTAGAFTVTATATYRVSIGATGLMPDPSDPGKMSLFVGGTPGNDSVSIVAAARGQVQVKINGKNHGKFTVTGRLIVYGGAGNDTLSVATSIKRPALLDGGAGNDILQGGSGNDILVGGPGRDRLFGRAGRDLLIGGGGADRLFASAKGDILIGGGTAFDADHESLHSITAEWTSRRTYKTRAANLRGSGHGSGANGTVRLVTAGPEATILGDGALDLLSGGAGQDWFFAKRGGATKDAIVGHQAGELVEPKRKGVVR